MDICHVIYITIANYLQVLLRFYFSCCLFVCRLKIQIFQWIQGLQLEMPNITTFIRCPMSMKKLSHQLVTEHLCKLPCLKIRCRKSASQAHSRPVLSSYWHRLTRPNINKLNEFVWGCKNRLVANRLGDTYSSSEVRGTLFLGTGLGRMVGIGILFQHKGSTKLHQSLHL